MVSDSTVALAFMRTYSQLRPVRRHGSIYLTPKVPMLLISSAYERVHL